MLFIRQEQMDAFSVPSRFHLVDKVLAVLDCREPALQAPEHRQTVSRLLKRAVDRAFDELGCLGESAAADYAGLVYEFGFEFERDARVTALLAESGRSMDSRIQSLFLELKDDDWLRLRQG